MGYALHRALDIALFYRDKCEPGLWSISKQIRSVSGTPREEWHKRLATYIHTGADPLYYGNSRMYHEADLMNINLVDSCRNAPLIEMELYRALPAPPPEVSFEDILEFKNRRKDELLSLRYALDELYLEIIDSNDAPRKTGLVLRKLQKNLLMLHKIYDERWKQKLLSTLTVELNLKNVASGSIGGAALGSIFSIPIEIGSALGAAATALKFTFSTDNKLVVAENIKDYSYVYHVEKELR
jgi:hypothetical protein